MEKNKFSWYMISTVSGKEDLVIESLKNRIIAEVVEENFDMDATETGAFKIFKKPTLTSREAQKKLKGEEYKIKWVNMYGGYIFIRMLMTDRAWFVVRNTQYVTGLIGSSGKGAKPTPVSQKEIDKMFLAEEKAMIEFKDNKGIAKFDVNDILEVIEGPFKGQVGKVLRTNEQQNKVELEIEVFGKRTPVEFDYSIVKLTEE
ncbi:transcription termination/antitermination protein NusG [Mycoplasmopsis hyopharyngis]|uniref:transcription termination/antitermination protein NusG n=1 Tax=Mycoplasmopsis hyopharyngis TaxID=29558 RepID=UPI00387380ED